MGYNKPRNPFRKLTTKEILDLFDHFYWWRLITHMWWKNYVIDDHTRVIVEMTRNPLMFARHLFRSKQGFIDPEEIEETNFTEYWVAKMNTKTDTVEILKHSPPDNYQDIRLLYLQHQGTGNWCK
jgi:hypothetical protein